MLKHDNVLEMYVTAVRGRDANSRPIVTRRLIYYHGASAERR